MIRRKDSRPQHVDDVPVVRGKVILQVRIGADVQQLVVHRAPVAAQFAAGGADEDGGDAGQKGLPLDRTRRPKETRRGRRNTQVGTQRNRLFAGSESRPPGLVLRSAGVAPVQLANCLVHRLHRRFPLTRKVESYS